MALPTRLASTFLYLFCSVFLSAHALAEPVESSEANARLEQREILLATCFRYPEFRVEDVRRQHFGPELYDLVFYELNYRKVDRFLLLFIDAFGKIVSEREMTRETPQQKVRFEISARFGDEQTIARDVKRYLRSNEVNACK